MAQSTSGNSYLYCFTHSNIGTNAQISEKLKDLSQGIAGDPPIGLKGRFSNLRKCAVQECVVGENHVAVLLEDGRICRISYSEEIPPVSTSAPVPPPPLSTPKEKSDDDGASTSSARSLGSRSASPRPDNEDRGSSLHVWGTLRANHPGSTVRLSNRGRIWLRRRGGARGLIARWPIIPASEVPDELVDQAMSVLQDKSREMVIRELQRTNLDVNQALNNLLSREDDDPEDMHEESAGMVGLNLPSGEELLSLLGSGLVSMGEEELEEALGRSRGGEGSESTGGRESRVALYEFGDPLTELRSLVSIGDGAAGGGTRGAGGTSSGGPSIEDQTVPPVPRPSSSSGGGGSSRTGDRSRRSGRSKIVAPGTSSGSTGAKKKKEGPTGPLLFDSTPDWWGGDDDGPVFKHIAGLHSELYAVDSNGKLHGWPWSSDTPLPRPHPLEARLQLQDEKIKLINGKFLRASVITESGKLATWVNETVRGVAKRMEVKVLSYPELSGETVTQLHVSELVSAVVTESSKIFWWGVLPFTERKQSIMQSHDKIRQYKYHQSSNFSSMLNVGCKVSLRSSPVYNAGGKGIHMKGTRLQCGVLQTSVISPTLSDKCTFKVINGAEQEEESQNKREKEEEDMEHQPSEVDTVHVGSKRKYSEHLGDVDGDRGGTSGTSGGAEVPEKTEEWSLRDVIFVDHVTNLNIGSVVKLDGNYVAVHYPALEEEELQQVDISKCRLLRKEELVPVSEASSYQTPYFIQETPRRLRPPPGHSLLAMACDSRGVHALYNVHNQLRYMLFNLDSGKFHQNSHFSELSSKYLIKQGGLLQLVPINLSLGVVIDKHGGLFPISKNNIGNIRDLQMLHISPVSCVSVGVCSSRNSLVGVALKKQVLMPAILRCDLQAVQNILEQLRDDPAALTTALRECCSGGCNIFHILSYLGKPPDPSPSNQGEKRGVAARTVPKGGMLHLRELMKQAVAMASGSSDWINEEGEEFGDSLMAADTANDIVELMNAYFDYRDVLTQLLQERNLDGYTPFMSAVVFKAYGTARLLFNLAERLSAGQEETLLSMLFPADSHPDDNPVFVLCRSDPCSFTWTGEEHIQQDIFECRTCGLTGSLCCCTECAYTCHRGHDCSFKRASPTAYCDCWEGGKCQSLALGDSYDRKTLLNKMLGFTNLGTRVNKRKQHLLGMVASTLVRQQKEQSNYSTGSLHSSSAGRSSRSHGIGGDEIPAYNLSPPKFAQKGLAIVMENWACVKAALMSEGTSEEGVGSAKGQTSTVSLDSFTHTLLLKLNSKILDTLLTMLVSHIGPQRDQPEGVEVANRFLRSVIRVFTVCQMEVASVPPPSMGSSRKKHSSSTPLMERARRIFSSLAPLSLHQLVPMARALILPVTMGIARPVDSICVSDSSKEASDNMFRLPPVSLLRVPLCEDEGAGGEGCGLDQDMESEMGDGEEDNPDPLLPSVDPSSAPVAANLLYLSDQESSDAEDLDSGGDDISVQDFRAEEEILFESHSSHRSTQDSHWALPSARGSHSSSSSHHHHHHHSARLSRTTNSSHRSGLSMGASMSLLAKTFGLLVRQLADTLDSTWDMVNMPTPPYVLPVQDSDPAQLYDYVWAELHEVWEWLFKSMDVLESQLRFGTATCRKLVRTPPSHKSDSTSEAVQSRKDLFAYVLTLLRGQFQEHGGVLPAVDMGGMEHLAWCFDALFYLLQHSRSSPVDHTQATPTVFTSDSSQCRFFRRSESIVCLGTVPLSPFDPLPEALPLAEKPHLLDGTQDKEMLFGYQMSTLLQDWPQCPLPDSPLRSLLSLYPGGPGRTWPRQTPSASQSAHPPLSVSLSADEMCGWDSHKLTASILVGRWGGCLEVFSQAFMDSVGKQKNSVLSQEQHFKHREKEFRKEMDYMRATCHKEIVMEVERSRDKFIPELFSKLNQYSDHQPLPSLYGTPPFCIHRFKVTFVGEPGEGSGVLRSLFTATAEAVLANEPLPWYELLPSGGSGETGAAEGSRGGGRRGRSKDKASSAKTGSSSSSVAGKRSGNQDGVVEPPLFYQPGKAGYYAPRTSTKSALRLNAFRNVGRMIGLCLLHTEVMPLTLCRHVFKFLVNRQISWHDLAFFDPAVYESLRKMILDSRESNGAELLSSLGLTFSVTLSTEEGGEAHVLKVDGANVPVTPDNVYEYVKKYSELRMVEVCRGPLEEMRGGMQEVLPKSLLSSLTAEDLRLMLCGCPHIDVEVLRGITVFDDESHKEMDTLSRFKGWFWAVLERMTQRERQDLLYFWSSSPVLPASAESYQPRPSVTIRPPDDQQFPTANTCISRLYIPLYSSKAILRARLLTAIKTKTFGFV